MLYHPDDPDLAKKVSYRYYRHVFGMITFPIVMFTGYLVTFWLNIGVFGLVLTTLASLAWLRATRYEVFKILQTDDRPLDDMPDHVIEGVRNKMVRLENSAARGETSD